MKNKTAYIIVVVVVIVLIVFFATQSDVSAPSLEEASEDQSEIVEENEENKSTSQSSPAPSPVTKTQETASQTTQPDITTETISELPEIEFIDKRTTFKLDNFPDVEITIEKVAFGRGEAAVSTGCRGIPNANFSTYLFPGDSICVSATTVDGSPRGIIAFHILVENNGNFGFGGNSDTFRLHYLRADSTGEPTDKFAYPLNDFSDYYIESYSSGKAILSYLVPEDQLVFGFISGYTGPSLENKSLSVYDLSASAFLVDFGSAKDIKMIK